MAKCAPAHDRQVIHIHLGQFGCGSGKQIWELYCKEHGIEKDGTISETAPFENMNRFNCFTESFTGVAKPKSLFLDMSPHTLNGIANSDMKRLFDADYMITGPQDADNNFAKARYGCNRVIHRQMYDRLRELLEECDCAKTSVTLRASSGGCGGGMSPSALQFVYDQSLTSVVISLEPSNSFTNTIIAPYNHILSMAQCHGVADLVIPLQNDYLHQSVVRHVYGINPIPESANVSYAILNEEIATTMSHLQSERFHHSMSNMSWSGMVHNLVPFPELKYMTTYTSRASHHSNQDVHAYNDPKLFLLECLQNSFISVSKKSMYIVECLTFRGAAKFHNIINAMEDFETNPIFSIHHQNRFIPYIPSRRKQFHNSSPVLIPDSFKSQGVSKSCIRISNESGIEEMMLDSLEKYSAIYNTGSCVHWYLYEGMQHEEFENSFHFVKELADSYGNVLHRNSPSNDDSSDDDEMIFVEPSKEEIA